MELALLAIAAFVAYFFPTFIAVGVGHRNALGIFVLNVFLGWIFVGWVAALIWSVVK